MVSLQWEIVELADHLRNEKLFVASEQQNLRTLNKEVSTASTRLAQHIWILNQQRLNLRRLILSHPDCPPYVCTRRARNLDSTRFIDGHKVLGVQECIRYGDFLLVLRSSPRLLAACLTAASQPTGGSKSQSSNSSVSSNSSCDGGSTACGVGSVIGATVPLMPPEALSGIFNSLLSGLYCGWDLEDDNDDDVEDSPGDCSTWRAMEDPLPDERNVPFILRLLRHLAKVQIVMSPDPRRILSQGSCAFARMYSSIREGLLSLRLFLTAALHKPICHLIAYEWKKDAADEVLEDLDGNVWDATAFGWDAELDDPGGGEEMAGGSAEDWKNRGFDEPPFDATWSANNKKRKGCSRKAAIRLAALVRRFLRSLRANARHFPAPLRWLIAHVRQEMLLAAATSVNSSSSVFMNGDQEVGIRRDSAERVAALCTDLAFTSIVCPAVADPAAHGVISLDMPISVQARRRLMQVAKALQGLALRPFQEEDPRLADLYGLFEKDCVSSIVECMLEDEDDELEDEMVCGEEDETEGVEAGVGGGEGVEVGGEGLGLGMGVGGAGSASSTMRARRGRRRKQRKRRRERLSIPPPIVHSSYTRGLSRSAALFTESELLNLVSFLQTVYTESQSSLVDKKLLAALLNLLPATGIIVNGKHSSISSLQPPQSVSVSPITAGKRALLLGRVTRTRSIRTLSPAGPDVLDEGVGGEEDVTPPAGSPMGTNGLSSSYRPASPREDVLVIPFNHSGSECIGMLPEEKVLEMEWERRQGRNSMVGVSGVRTGGVPLIGGASMGDRELSGKRTRFSLSHDEGSIVSTLEPGEVDGVNVGDETRSVEVEEEEAVSNHSVASSLELGTEEEEEEEEDDGRRGRRVGKRRGGGEGSGGIGGPGEEDQLALDNLSDMVSANVSSRGTPNISGRDTPSSQITEGDGEEDRVGGSGGAEEEDGSGVGGAVGGIPEGADVVGVNDAMGPGLEEISGEGGLGIGGIHGMRGGPHPPNCRHRHPVSKQQHQQQQQQTRSDIDDKFGKFEIKKLIEGDETVSLVSDTWSTDVLASDSETVDLNRDSAGSGSALGQANPSNQLSHVSVGQAAVGAPSFSLLSLFSLPNEDGLMGTLGPGGLGSTGGSRQDPSGQLLDVSETGSEAWSVDVLASDYERMCEVDTDDAGSVARSDDTARSELETEGVGVRGELERVPSMGDEMGAAGIARIEEKATPPLHNAMGARGPSPGLSSRGLSPGPASTFRPIREEEEALLAGEIELSTPCQRPTPRYITSGVPSQGVEEGKLEGPVKLEEECIASSLKPPVEFSSQGIDQLPNMPPEESPVVPPNQIFLHQLCGQFSGASISTPLKPPPHEHHIHHRRRNRHAHTKSSVVSSNLLGGQGSMMPRPNGRARGEDDVDDEEDDDDDVDLEEELEADFLSGPGCGARLSSTSLASSSSSSGGGGDGARRRIISAVAPQPGLPILPPVEALGAEGAVLAGEPVVVNSFNQQQPSTNQGRIPLMGAIPKSISFDKTAERGDKDLLEDDHKQKRSFFRFKLPFKSRVRKPGRGSGTASVDDLDIHGYGSAHLSFDGSQGSNERTGHSVDSLSHARLRQHSSVDSAIPSQNDAMEDILAKYRRKPEATPTGHVMGESPVSLSSLGVTPAVNGLSLPSGQHRPHSSLSGELSLMRRKQLEGGEEEGGDSDEDSEGENEDCPEEDTGYGTGVAEDEEVALEDAKRKLRLVLSTANVLHPLEGRPMGHGLRETASTLSSSASLWANTNGGLPGMCVPNRAARSRLIGTGNELVSFLRLQLAEAVSLHDDVHQPNTIHIRETLRCVMAFDNQRCLKLFRGLRDDYRRRAPYLAYLVRCKQGLLSTLTHLERLLERTGREKQACSKALIWVCIRLFVKRHEKEFMNFVADFGRPTAAVDEKAVLVRSLLRAWNSQMEEDPTWQGASEEQVELARISLERVVMGRVYLYALYPNGDGDISRDQVLHEHMKKLSKVIKPCHKDLRIPKVFCRECPWPSAQAEISAIGTYCTPRDKVDCVSRTCLTLITLLAMASERTGAPAADDLIPVLVYVLIKANPPSLLSTVQFVNSFHGSNLSGADQYWWVQFCSAIEFIKTMDYSD